MFGYNLNWVFNLKCLIVKPTKEHSRCYQTTSIMLVWCNWTATNKSFIPTLKEMLHPVYPRQLPRNRKTQLSKVKILAVMYRKVNWSTMIYGISTNQGLKSFLVPIKSSLPEISKRAQDKRWPPGTCSYPDK